MSRPFRCSERPTAMKPTASTTIAMIAQITMGAVSQMRGRSLADTWGCGAASDALLRWSRLRHGAPDDDEEAQIAVIDQLVENHAR
jgi:hypothetical protein